MIYYIGNTIPNSNIFFQTSKFTEFKAWITNLYIYQHDLESNVTDSIVERKMTLAQYGDIRGKDQWVIDPRTLSPTEAKELVDIMNNQYQIKVIHNVSFEYKLWKKYGVHLTNVYDTMLAEKVLDCGNKREPGYYGLAGLVERYLYKNLDKELQTSFDTKNFSVDQIYYAANDVKYLGGIRRLQIDEAKSTNLLNVIALENESVLGFGDIEYYGMRLDQEAWRKNIDLADPIIDEAKDKLDNFIRGEEFRDKSIELGYLSKTDELVINWNSPSTKKLIFGLLYPEINGASKAVVTKYVKAKDKIIKRDAEIRETRQDYQGEEDTLQLSELREYIDSSYSRIEDRLRNDHKEFLVSNNLLVPEGTISINWQSPLQRLEIFKLVEPQLKNTKKESLADCDHPIIEAYTEYINTLKLKTSFGERFINENVDSDGRVRTNFNQVLNTGRVSSSKPNLQNIPAKESVGNRYRNAFIADTGWKFVDSDYKSQELVILAYFSRDPVWAEALSKNQDLHSVCAEQVFKDRWKEGAEEGCKFYKVLDSGELLKDKCKCKRHKTLRTLVKTINFGLALI